MADKMKVFIFGDQTFDASDLMLSLLHTHDDVILSSFLDSSVQVLKGEITQLSFDKRSACPRFSRLTDLIPYWCNGKLNPALDQALTCICHLGTFLHEHAAPGRQYPTARNACLSARCTGFISSVAVSCSTSSSDLLVLGLKTVSIAFRVGACAWDMGSLMFTTQEKTGEYPSWTCALAGFPEEEVTKCISDYAVEKGLPTISRPYISARITTNRTSVSAPPHILNDLLTNTELSRATRIELPITAPYHAPHLFSKSDVDAIVADIEDVPALTLIPIISSSTGTIIQASTFREALRTSVEACLQETIRSDLVATSLAYHIGYAKEFSIQYIATAPDGLGSAVQSLLGPTIRNSVPQDDSTFISTSLPNMQKSKSKIAILAMSGRFPQAPSMDAFWHVLQDGVDTHEAALESRWNVRTHVGDVSLKALPKNTSGTGFGCWLHDAAQFDARFFNMSPREAPQVDPAQRLALLTAAEALEQSGIVPGRTASTQKDRVGVYFGSTSNDWMETNSAQNIDTYFIPGGNRAFIPGRINYHFKFSGPSYTIDTACSSSFTAIHLACNALWKGEVDTAIVGGTNVLTNPDMTAGLDRGHFLSRTGNCKTFDDTADGYCRGEAVATAVLKRLDDALADKDPIQACILSIATNHSAEAESITRPHVGAQQALFENVLADAGIKPTDISYCEMHGTGTQAGDAGETMSVLQSIAPDQPARAVRTENQKLYIGAAKSNVGHGEAAAGVTSLAKVLLMLKNSTIPPHCGIKTKINHKLPNLAARNAEIAMQPIPWARPINGKRKVLLNNFSAAGGNTALVLEDAPDIATSNLPDVRPSHLIAISAKAPVALEQNLKNLVNWLSKQSENGNTTLARLSYTTTARRSHHPHRVMITATDLHGAITSLQQAIESKEGSSRPKGTPSYIFAFTGQGAQFAGMGADLYNRIKSFRTDIHRYDQICRQLQFPSIRHLFQSSSKFTTATPTMLQLASVCFQMALFRMWQSFGVTPSAVVGHSLGEYAALYAASVLTQVDVINIVGKRAQLLESHCEEGSHAMLAVRSSPSNIEATLGRPGSAYEVSCYNGRESVVLGGTKAQLEAIRPSLQRSRMSHRILEVPYAYHTAQVEPILGPLHDVVKGVKFEKPAIPVISPTYGRVLTQSADFGQDFIIRHCRNKVDMMSALEAAKDMHLVDEKTMGIEIGPEPVVIKMVKEVVGPAFRTFASSRKGEDGTTTLTTALSAFYTAGADINWTAYHADFSSCQVVLDLPAYAWDLKEYWIQYVHDWSLRKGEPPLVLDSISTNLEGTCIHKIVENSLSVHGGDLVVEADLSREDLHPMVQGHKVYGVPLCTPSVYADIALKIGQYAMRFMQPNSSGLGIEVASMNIQSALVANADGKEQLLRTTAKYDPGTKSVFCVFSSVGQQGNVKEQHSNCILRLFDIEETRKSLEQTLPHIKLRISTLQNQLRDFSNTFRYSKAMIYKMVGKLADFDPKYRALEEITLDSDALEATGRVDFTKVVTEGIFHTNPAYIDALSQLGGFVMNANEGVDLDKELFVNHGWESLKLFEAIDPQKIYKTHVKMTEGKDKLWTGDITILDGERIVGMFGGVALQGVPKRLMSYIVNAASKRTSRSPSQKSQNIAPSRPAAVPPGPPKLIPAAGVVVNTSIQKSMIAPIPAQDNNNIVTAMRIISQESGISLPELTDDTRFDDIGVDSLLGLMVSSRVRDELGIDLDSSTFLDTRTIGSFKLLFRGLSGPVQQEAIMTEVVKEQTLPVAVVTEKAVQISPVVLESTSEVAAPVLSTAVGEMNRIWSEVLNILAEESRINVTELTGDTTFSDIGVDSLLSLVVVSRMRDELELDIPDQSLFLDYPSVDSLKARIVGFQNSPLHGSVTSDSDLSTDVSSIFTAGAALETPEEDFTLSQKHAESVLVTTAMIPTHKKEGLVSVTEIGRPKSKKHDSFMSVTEMPPIEEDSFVSVTEILPPVKPAWSIILQGSPRTAKEILFLFPDGCGAATSYLKLPTLSPTTAVIAFNSPFMKKPHDMLERRLSEVVGSYVESVRRHQPHGRYHLAGWSAGGILAYAIAQHLMAAGDEIASLTLIDSPEPNDGLDRLPRRFFDHCSAVGLFGEEMSAINPSKERAKLPEWLMPHFEATIELLHDYHAPPMPYGRSPSKISIIWAGGCAFGGKYAPLPPATMQGEDSEGMKFLTEQRTDFGPGKWAVLFPGKTITVNVVQGEHHFSMMRGKGADQLGKYLRQAMGLSM